MAPELPESSLMKLTKMIGLARTPPTPCTQCLKLTGTRHTHRWGYIRQHKPCGDGMTRRAKAHAVQDYVPRSFVRSTTLHVLICLQEMPI